MRYKLVDADSITERDVQFGTCELCMYTSDLTTTTFTFEDEQGNIIDVEGGYWDWGFYDDFSSGLNYIDFAEYIKKTDIDDIESNFINVVNDYYESDFYREEEE